MMNDKWSAEAERMVDVALRGVGFAPSFLKG
jgi:hypothetical protein